MKILKNPYPREGEPYVEITLHGEEVKHLRQALDLAKMAPFSGQFPEAKDIARTITKNLSEGFTF